MNHSLRLRAIAVAAFTLAGGLAAHSTAVNAAEDQLPEVKVSASKGEGYVAPTAAGATKSEAPLRDIPQTINVVPAEVIRDQGALSIQDMMKNIPGVGLSTGDGQRDQVFIRGFTAIGDQFVDGIRDDALYFRDLSNVERLEVVKGPAAVLYGRGSSGGLVNRVTKKPGVNISEIGLTYGSYNDKRAEFDLGRTTDAGVVSWRLTGAVEDANSYRDQQFLKRKAIAPSVELKFSADTKLLLQADYLEDRRLTDFGIPAFNGRPVNVDPSTYYGPSNARDADYSQARVTSTSATFTHRFNESLSFKNAFRYYDYKLNRNNTTINGDINAAAQTMTFNHATLLRDENGFFNQSELTQKVSFGGIKHEFLYGVEFGKQNKNSDSFTFAVPGSYSIFNPMVPALSNTYAALPSGNEGEFKTFGTYFQDTLAFSDHWKALLGVRWDSFEQQTLVTAVNQSKTDLNRTDRAFSPRVGLVWQPTTAQSYYVSWSKSFQPSGETLALAANNGDLAPEKTTNTEIGAKYDLLDGRANATVSLFRLERSGIKAVNPLLTTQLIPIGVQRTDGMEFTLSADLSSGWRAIAGYAYLDSKVTQSIAFDTSVTTAGSVPIQGKYATLTPRHMANFWVTKELGAGLTAGLGANAVGSRFANTGNTVSLPGYMTADAMASYKTGAYSLQLNVYNLFDRRYIVSGHGSSPNLSMPGSPRTAMVTLRYSM